MAITSRIAISLTVNNNLKREVQNLSTTHTGTHWDSRVLNIGTSEEEVVISTDVSGGQGAGFAFLKNIDATNYVQIGKSTGTYFARLNPGDVSLIKLDPGVTSLFMKANTGAVDVEFMILER